MEWYYEKRGMRASLLVVWLLLFPTGLTAAESSPGVLSFADARPFLEILDNNAEQVKVAFPLRGEWKFSECTEHGYSGNSDCGSLQIFAMPEKKVVVAFSHFYGEAGFIVVDEATMAIAGTASMAEFMTKEHPAKELYINRPHFLLIQDEGVWFISVMLWTHIGDRFEREKEVWQFEYDYRKNFFRRRGWILQAM